MTMSDSTSGLLLNGLDGGNPLGFLAAIGTLRIAADADRSVDWHMHWLQEGGRWLPVLTGTMTMTRERLIELLMPRLKAVQLNVPFQMNDAPAISFSDLAISCEEFRRASKKAYDTATSTNRHYADFMVAFGCDALSISKKNSNIRDTAFRTMSGAGHQHFIGSMRELVENTGSDHLHTSLFENWSYTDLKPSLRWDPSDDRRYALRWKQPSGDPIYTMRGANRLAIEALPIFPAAPGDKHLHTTGFSQRPGEGVFFSWPIWRPPLTMDVVRSLVSLAELQRPKPDRKRLSAIGIVEIYRSQRITRDKYRNFITAVPV